MGDARDPGLEAAHLLLQAVLNLSRFHREHEKYYAQAPLQTAVSLQEGSKTLKTLADRWRHVDPVEPGRSAPYAGCDDLNQTASIQANGVLFMEGQGEPVELTTLKRDLGTIAGDYERAGEWLAEAMAASWSTAEALLDFPALSDVLGERHRIIANDWQAASLSSLAARLLFRALDILARIELAPDAVRANLRGDRSFVSYLYSSSELIDRAADLVTEFATLVHDNERRWRVFRSRVEELTAAQGQE